MKKLFLCTCNKTLDKALDFSRIEKEMRRVFDSVETHDCLCLKEGLTFLSEKISQEDYAVLGACSSQIIGVPIAKSIDSNSIQIVPIREHVAWAHEGDQVALANKAIVLLSDASVRIDHMEEPSEVSDEVVNHVLVVGGGLSGLRVAIDLKNLGTYVTLLEPLGHSDEFYLENSRFMADFETVQKETKKLLKSLKGVKRIKGELVKVTGSIGAFETIMRDQDGGENNLTCGSIVIATGAEYYMPPISKTCRFGKSDRSVTLTSLLAEVKRKGRRRILLAIETMRPLSRVEGSHLLRSATLLANEGNTIILAHSDIRTEDEDLYRAARESGVLFIRGTLENVKENDDGLTCRLENPLESKVRTFEIDIIAVCQFVGPAGNTSRIADILQLDLNEFGFIKTRYSKMKPVQTSRRGVYLAGNTKMPMGLSDAMASAQNAALEAYKIVRSPIKRKGWIPVIDDEECDVCKACTEACPNDALRFLDEKIIHIPSHCEFCGICVSVCPTRAIEFQSFKKEGLLLRIETISETHKRFEGDAPFTLVYACSECANASIDQAGFAGKEYSLHTYVMQFPCAGMISPIELLKGLVVGAERVIVAHCPPGGCHHQTGDHISELNVELTRNLLKEIGQDPERVRATYMIAALPNRMQEEVGANE